jgi:hypothetical protein
MSGSKQFGSGEDFPQKSPSAGRPILEFDPDVPRKFIELLDTFLSYTGKAGLAVVVNETETGLTTRSVTIVNDKNYIHTQSVASAIWTITHNLGKYPSVRIKDGTGHQIIGDIVDVSINELTIEFTTTQSGIAILN